MKPNRPTHVNYLDVPEELQELYDIDAMSVVWAPYSRWFIGIGVGPEMLKERMITTRAEAERYSTEAKRRAEAPVPDHLLTTPAAQIYARIGRLGMSLESVYYHDPIVGRPKMSPSNMVGIKLVIDLITDNYGEEAWFTDDFARELLRTFMRNEPEDLTNGLELWFGPGSVGWMNGEEREGMLESLREAASDEARTGLLEYYTEHNGIAEDFDTLWETYTGAMAIVYQRYKAIPAGEPVRLGEAAYNEILSRLGIGHSVMEFYEHALAQYDRINAEMDRLVFAKGSPFNGNPMHNWKAWQNNIVAGAVPNDDTLLAKYRARVDALNKLFIAHGIFEMPPRYKWEFRVTPAEMRSTVPTAMYIFAPYHGDERTGTFMVTPCGGDKQAWKAHFLDMDTTGAHEMAHGLCNGWGPQAVPSFYDVVAPVMLVAQEGVTVTMEGMQYRLKGAAPTAVDMLVALKGLAWRAARVIAEIEWHLGIGNKSLDQITREYMQRSRLDEEAAIRDLRRATVEVWQFAAYFIGAMGTEGLGLKMGGLKKAIRYQIMNTAGGVPQNMIAWAEGLIERPEDFNWLVDASLVEVSQRLFPDTWWGKLLKRLGLHLVGMS